MKNFYTYLLILSLFLNVLLAFETSDFKPSDVKVVKVSHKENQSTKDVIVSEKAKENSNQSLNDVIVSQDTTSFVVDFISKINQCDTFLWSVSENRKEIKYTIWFEK